jgi:hypothetical protein
LPTTTEVYPEVRRGVAEACQQVLTGQRHVVVLDPPEGWLLWDDSIVDLLFRALQDELGITEHDVRLEIAQGPYRTIPSRRGRIALSVQRTPEGYLYHVAEEGFSHTV